jgi:predicted Holliday junction resolvase-like endonuclease
MDFKTMRKTFCNCKQCGTVYRLSDSDCWEYDEDIDTANDILEKIQVELKNLEAKESKLREKLSETKSKATIDGRLAADEHIGRIDTLFKPLGLNPNDAKVHFHPVDFVVFNGMNDPVEPKIKNIVLLDSKQNVGKLQDSIRKCIEEEQYEFLTIKIKEDGTITTE